MYKRFRPVRLCFPRRSPLGEIGRNRSGILFCKSVVGEKVEYKDRKCSACIKFGGEWETERERRTYARMVCEKLCIEYCVVRMIFLSLSRSLAGTVLR